jgi:hypothetical protein
LPAGPDEVFVAGTWNAWTPGVDRLRRGSGQTRRAVVYLDPGRHLFRLRTAASRWFNDPAVETDGKNCVLVVPAP